MSCKDFSEVLFTAIPGASEGVPGVDLDMPDSILISLDLRNHQKHPKQKKNIPKIKSFFFLVPYLPIEAI